MMGTSPPCTIRLHLTCSEYAGWDLPVNSGMSGIAASAPHAVVEFLVDELKLITEPGL